MKPLYIRTNHYQCKVEPNGVITGFQPTNSNTNLIPDHNGWGCELGNWYSFFSQSKHLNQNTLINNYDNHQLEFEFIVELPKESKIRVLEKIIFKEKAIIQEFDFLALSPSVQIGDFVNRFVIKSGVFHQTVLNNKTFKHRSANIYHQFFLNEVQLINNNLNISIENQINIPKNYATFLDKVVYVRDEPKLNQSQSAWVIHSRLITNAKTSSSYVLRWFYPNVLLPNMFAKILGFRMIRSLFWRLKERWPRSPISLGGIINLRQNDHFVLKSTIRINN